MSAKAGGQQPLIKGLVELIDLYDSFIIDLWGVIHNGQHLYDGALECLQAIKSRNKTIVFLSNAPRASGATREQLQNLGISSHLYDGVITSGDLVIDTLRKLPAESYFHIGVPEKDASLLIGIGMNPVSRMQDADILIASNYMSAWPKTEDYYLAFDEAIAKDVPMYCANPDLYVRVHENLVPCAGMLAKTYEQRGGKVYYFGKPYASIYELIFSKYKGGKWLAIGDSLATDITGASNAGIDSWWVLSGIHKSSEDLLAYKNIQPTYIYDGFLWS
ncbi:MAG: TIGR01459 family HAD-type hydrolase [Alphaproteobacteria bacterium]|nr:TIGR01459 family HAD-type hydrolase [Alphaproteobacteria bacterium]